jgi:hypothetical protein
MPILAASRSFYNHGVGRMPRVFDNIEQQLLPALREALTVAIARIFASATSICVAGMGLIPTAGDGRATKGLLPSTGGNDLPAAYEVLRILASTAARRSIGCIQYRFISIILAKRIYLAIMVTTAYPS